MQPREGTTHPVWRRGAVFAVCVIVGLLFADTASAAAGPTPLWQLGVTSQPTNLVPGSPNEQIFLITATNVGAADTQGPITIEDELPVGLTPQAGDCEVVGQRAKCIVTETVHPGRFAVAFIPVTVEPALAATSLESVVSIRGGDAEAAETTLETEVSASLPSFDFLPQPVGLDALLNGPNAVPVFRGGEAPYQLTIDTRFPSRSVSGLRNVGHPRDISVDLPPGLALDPAATPRCRESQLTSGSCPRASMVGRITVTTALGTPTFEGSALYNMVAPDGSAASLGFEPGKIGIYAHLLGSLRGNDFGLTAGAGSILAKYPFLGMKLQLWGNPSDPAHDQLRGGPVEALSRPLLTMPSSCGPLSLTARADSWESPGAFVTRTAPIENIFGVPAEVEECAGSLDFDPMLSVKPSTSVADSPAGLDVSVEVPQGLVPTGATASSLRRAEVTLPAGTFVNPAAASGLAACTPAEIGLATPIGQSPARFDAGAVTCPAASKLGTVEAVTPLLEDETEAGKPVPHPLTGSIYLAQPGQNPYSSLFAVYVAVDDRETGAAVKLPGEVELDPVSGRVTATFSELPQLPFERFKLDFFNGPQGPIRTPAVCGESATRAELTPWSGAAPTGREDRFAIVANPSGGNCVTAPDRQPNAPRFDAGTLAPQAGHSSRFVLHLARADGSQEFGALNLDLPPGLTGVLAGTSACPEAALAAAATETAREEQAKPSCPAASRVGHVAIGLGAGPTPFQTEGGVYLAGPYRGAPLSLAVVTPAVAGPFDLGTVVVRVAVFVNPVTGRLSARSDPLPRLLAGVPLDVRTLTLELDKPGLILNPTSCEPMSVDGEAISTSGQMAPTQSRFQVGECAALPFKPALSMRFSGALGRNGHPALRAVLRTKARGAALASASFELPAAELLDLRHLDSLCPRGTAVDECPGSSRLGYLRLRSPSLEEPLVGPVYLRVPSHRLPDLTAEVSSGPFRFLLRGRTIGAAGRIGVSLGALPDLPLSKAVLTLAGGRRGIVVNSRPLCRGTGVAAASITAHNGKRRELRVRPRLGPAC